MTAWLRALGSVGLVAAAVWAIPHASTPPPAVAVEGNGHAQPIAATASLAASGHEPGCEEILRAEATARTSPVESVHELVFLLRGLTPAQCRGTVTLARRTEHEELPITDARVAVEVDVDVHRIDLSVADHAVVSYLRVTPESPFEAVERPIDVHLARAGEIVVEVVDDAGHPLVDRYVQCFRLPGQASAEEADGPLQTRTSSWAWTDTRGVARIPHVLPGSYRIDANAIAEWGEATAQPVQVDAGRVASCRLDVPVLRPDEYGGFVIPTNAADFLSWTGSGKVRHYVFRSEGGHTYRMFRIGDAIRCVVRGRRGDTMRGCIQADGRSGPDPLQQSEPITVTIGAMPTIHPRWHAADLK